MCKLRGVNVQLWENGSPFLPYFSPSYLLPVPWTHCVLARKPPHRWFLQYGLFHLKSQLLPLLFVSPFSIVHTCPIVSWLFSETFPPLAGERGRFLRAGAVKASLFFSPWCSVGVCWVEIGQPWAKVKSKSSKTTWEMEGTFFPPSGKCRSYFVCFLDIRGR